MVLRGITFKIEQNIFLLWVVLIGTHLLAYGQGNLEIFAKGSGLPNEEALLIELETIANEIQQDVAIYTDDEITDTKVLYGSGYSLTSKYAGTPSVFQQGFANFQSQYENYISISCDFQQDGSIHLNTRIRLNPIAPVCQEWHKFNSDVLFFTRIIESNNAISNADIIDNLQTIREKITRNLCCGNQSQALNSKSQDLASFRSSSCGQMLLDPIALGILLDEMLNDPIYLAQVTKLRNYADQVLNKCYTTNFAPPNNGIIPKCFWESQPLGVPPYSGLDLPFTCGVVDGVYSQVKGIYDLVVLAGSADQYVQDLLYYNTMYWLQCRSGTLSADPAIVCEQLCSEAERYSIDELEDAGLGDKFHYFNGTTAQLMTSIDEINKAFPFLEIPRTYEEDCAIWEQKASRLNVTLEVLLEASTYASALDSIVTSISGFFDTALGFDNEARYTHAKIAIEVAALYVGAAELKAVGKGLSKFARGLAGAKGPQALRLSSRKLSEGVAEKVAGKLDNLANTEPLTRAMNESSRLRNAIDANPDLVKAWESIYIEHRERSNHGVCV